MAEDQAEQGSGAASGGMAAAIWHNGPTQAGIGVSIITLVAQTFARDEVQAVVAIPGIAVAMFTALLLAFYQVRFVQVARFSESLVLVPLTTIILFAMALGATNTVDVAGGDTAERTRVNAELVEVYRAQIEALEQGRTEPDPEPLVEPMILGAGPETGSDSLRMRGPATAPPQAPEADSRAQESAAAAERQRRLEDLKQRERELLERRKQLEGQRKPFWNPW